MGSPQWGPLARRRTDGVRAWREEWRQVQHCNHSAMKKAAEAAFTRTEREGRSSDTLRSRRRRALLPVTLTELLDASGRVNDLLLSRVERMARRTNFDVQRLVNRRARLERDAAAACHVDFAVFGMNIGFHCVPLAWARNAGNPAPETPSPRSAIRPRTPEWVWLRAIVNYPRFRCARHGWDAGAHCT